MPLSFKSKKDAVIHRAAQQTDNGGYWMGYPEGWIAYLPNFYGWECFVEETSTGTVHVHRYVAGSGYGLMLWEKSVLFHEMQYNYVLRFSGEYDPSV